MKKLIATILDPDRIRNKVLELLGREVPITFSYEELGLSNTENLPVNLESADDAFSRYLKECYTKSSEEYFVKIVQFVSLFRDFLNCKNQGENKEDIYSIKKGAMKLPDSCNEFVSDFVEKKHQLGIEMTDCIDLIQHFCFWLHQNKYTKSILSLLVDN